MDEQQQNQQEQPLTKKQRRELKRQEKVEGRQKEARKKTTNRIIMWVVIIVGLGAMVYGLTLLGDEDSSTSPILVDAVTDTDQTKGTGDVVLVEYSDFQCPACASFYQMVNQLGEEFASDIKIVYRHFPLRSIHSNAQLAGQAAEAAAAQGKFWEMHDKLFSNQTSWAEEGDPTDTFVIYAGELGLDTELFTTDLTSEAIKEKVDADYRSGTAAKVNSTPSFFLQGEKINNPRSYEELSGLVQAAIGTPAAELDDTVENTDDAGESMGDTSQE